MDGKDSLLLLNNGTLAYILGNGDYRFTNLKFDEARAIIEMKKMRGEDDVALTFHDPDLEKIICDYVGIDEHAFPYQPVKEMQVGQDAIAFKLYITPSGSQPIVLGEGGQQARKIKNVYLYCQHVVRLK